MSAKNTEPREISFRSDGLALKGTLHLPPSDKPPIVIGLHGLYSSQESPKQIALARACNALGLAYLRFDHRMSHEQHQNDFIRDAAAWLKSGLTSE
jgi:dipeptidyl aminopeptidase/acylaminoacyl peptidase